MPFDRRKTRRFGLRENAFAVISRGPIKLVPITDIGMGGIGIFLSDGDSSQNRSSKMEIMAADCSFHLENIPFQIVANKFAFPANPKKISGGRRCSIKFGNLTPGQKSRLKHFIRNYTEGGLVAQFLKKLNTLLHQKWAPQYSADRCHTRILSGLNRSRL